MEGKREREGVWACGQAEQGVWGGLGCVGGVGWQGQIPVGCLHVCVCVRVWGNAE